MSPERWQRIKELFGQALEREPSARAAFVAGHSNGDDELRREVQSLLAAHEKERGRFERPAVDLVTGLFEEHDPAAMIGQQVGPYRLLREVGWGGMGTVYEAVRADEEYRKTVAIKVIRRGMDTDLVRRFRHERQILAGLEHPNIARLLDGGMTADGRPYFAMEYVQGQAIDEYCKARSLPVRERLALFLEVCEAVQYAHRNLVVHRDLKPRNILVTETGQPKLLDFGIAKLLGPADEEAAKLTRAGDHVLTPEYAAPEQVRGEPVTTVSDVYSLGVVLYELLAGHPPYQLKGRPLPEILRTITEDEPVSPSAMIGQRAVDTNGGASRLRRQLAGDLDSIVMMAIRKEPERRYVTVDQFGKDLRRYLQNRPVLARPDTTFYRVRKFVRRHAAGVTAAALVLVTLAGGIVATASQARRAETERALAEERFEDVRALANALLFEIHDAIADLAGATAARSLLVRRGIEYLDELSRQSSGDPALERELAAGYLRLGLVQGQPTGANLGDLKGARESYRRALSIARRLLEADSGDRGGRRSVALAHEKLADVEAWSGDVQSGVQHARAALRHWRILAEADDGDASTTLPVAISHVKLGDLLGHSSFPNLGDRAGAMAEYRRALALLKPMQTPSGAADTEDWTARRYAGLLHERIGAMHLLEARYDAALASFDESFALRQALSDENRTNTDALRDVGIAHEKICSVHLARGDTDGALPRCEQALEVYRQLYQADPENTQSLNTLAIGHRWLYRVLAAQGDLTAALAELERSTALLRGRLDLDRDNVATRRRYAHNLLYLSTLHARMSEEVAGSAPERKEHLRKSASSYEQGQEILQALHAKGQAVEADQDLLGDVRAQLDPHSES
ncbi:hypothetical protein BH24PSE2_BH24PSE2_23710 [soil metagenome]